MELLYKPISFPDDINRFVQFLAGEQWPSLVNARPCPVLEENHLTAALARLVPAQRSRSSMRSAVCRTLRRRYFMVDPYVDFRASC